MFKGGRPKDPIWDHFNRLVQGSKVTAQCKICLHIQTCKPDRMKAHYAKCAKQSEPDDLKQSVTSGAPQAEKRPSPQDESELPERKRQATLSSHVVRTTDTNKDHLPGFRQLLPA